MSAQISENEMLTRPVVDMALARLGPLRGVPLTLALGLGAADADLAKRLRRLGAKVHEGLDSCPPSYVLGAVDEDLAGHLGATTRAPKIAQKIPTVDLSGSPLMSLAHDQIGIGQASVLALLDITNLQLAGRFVVVCGYGASGQAVAAHVAAFGARINVVERDPIRAAKALFDGHSVGRFAQCLPHAQVVFATDQGPQLQIGDANHLIGKTLLCAAGATSQVSPEIVALGGNLRRVRAHVSAFDLPHARDLKLIAEGRPLHLAEGQGLPFEVHEIVLALHILALGQLLQAGPNAPLISGLDAEAEAALATLIVSQNAGSLEP